MLSLLPATDEVKSNLAPIKTEWGTLYFDAMGTGDARSSSFRVYYQPTIAETSTSELDVTRALMSDEFLGTLYEHSAYVHEKTANARGIGADQDYATQQAFVANRKQAFGKAAVIIHDLVMDTVRNTRGGEIPYAMYVISEDGFAGYIGSRLQETADGVNAALSYAKEHPVKAGVLTVVAVVGGKVVANKGEVGGARGVDLYLGARTPSAIDQLLGDMNKFKFRSVNQITKWERLVARFKTIIPRLKLKLGNNQYDFNGDLEKARKVIADLTAFTGREVACLVLPDGRQVIRIGEKRRVPAGDAKYVIAHSHPDGLLLVSDDLQKNADSDTLLLAKTGQFETYLVSPTGNLVKWESASGKWVMI